MGTEKCFKTMNRKYEKKNALKKFKGYDIIKIKLRDSWFQNFAVFWMLYAFFWVIPRLLNFICRRFGTLCSIFIGGYLSANDDGTEFSETLAYKIHTPGNYPEESIKHKYTFFRGRISKTGSRGGAVGWGTALKPGMSSWFDSRLCQIFHWHNPHYVPGVDSASNRNECQKYFLGVKAAGV